MPGAPLGEDAAFLGSRGFIGMWEDGSGLVRTSGFLKEARNLGFYVTFLGVLRPFIQALPKGYREQIIHIFGLGFSPWQSVDSLGGKTVRERKVWGQHLWGEWNHKGRSLAKGTEGRGILSRQCVGALNVIKGTLGVRLET